MATTVQDLKAVLEREDDLAFEEEIARDRYSIKAWWSYIQAKRHAPRRTRNLLHERALKVLPGSYKLWMSYLADRRAQLKGKCVTDPAYEVVNNAYERALVTLHKMPRLWMDYCQLLVAQCKITRARRAFDRALQALPITQHDRIWNLYLPFARDSGVWEMALRVFRRFLKFDPSRREDYVEFLLSIKQYDEAAQQLAMIVSDDSYASAHGKTKHQLWMELCDLISKHPQDIRSVQCESVIRGGLRRFSDETGRLWCALADYCIRLGQFEKARDVYEEALDKVVTVRDFSLVFDAYTKYEESVVSAKMELAAEQEGAAEEEEEGEEEDDAALLDGGNDIELRLARLEALMERRPLLLSNVLLRQNRHNVHEWHKRAKLFKDPAKVIQVFTDAVKTVDPSKATGKPHTLWVSFAKFYERHGDLDNAGVILQKATEVNYRNVDDLASVWIEWSDMLCRNDRYDDALELLRRAVQEPPRDRMRRPLGGGQRPPGRVQDELHKCVRVWSAYLDLEESLGTLESARQAYDRVIELKVATPRMVLDYAVMLEEKKFFEDSFKVYEKGVALFPFPHVREIWLAYVTKFVQRYGGTKLERARDLFEQVVGQCPPDQAKLFYIQYAALEEQYGLVRRAMAVLDRATQAVAEADRMEMYLLYVKKAEEYYGVTKTRPIYERAIESLPDVQARDMCVRFAEMERRLGEIDRARALYAHAAQFSDPATSAVFWKQWYDFELERGNEDTFREMLQVKRSVQAHYAATVNFAVADAAAAASTPAAVGDSAAAGTEVARGVKRKAEEGGSAETEMQALERQAARPSQPAPDGVADVRIEQRAVPAAVFGDAHLLLEQQQRAAAAEAASKPMGALERLRARQG